MSAPIVEALGRAIAAVILRELEQRLAVARSPAVRVGRHPDPEGKPLRALRLIEEAPGAQWTPTILAHHMGLDRMAASVILRRLCAAGRIRRLDRGVFQARCAR